MAFRNPSSKISEEYRTIRTNLKFSSAGDKYRSLLVTSPNSGEGKSTTVVNLGASFAQQGEKVLIIDANLRMPILHNLFNVDNTIGLSTVLNGRSILETTVMSTGIARLEVLTSGPIPHNPAELLGSTSMNKLLNKVKELYDIVLFDTSPVREVTDTNIIANKCDGVILVLSYGRTEMEEAIETKRILDFSQSNIIGVVINQKT